MRILEVCDFQESFHTKYGIHTVKNRKKRAEHSSFPELNTEVCSATSSFVCVVLFSLSHVACFYFQC